MSPEFLKASSVCVSAVRILNVFTVLELRNRLPQLHDTNTVYFSGVSRTFRLWASRLTSLHFCIKTCPGLLGPGAHVPVLRAHLGCFSFCLRERKPIVNVMCIAKTWLFPHPKAGPDTGASAGSDKCSEMSRQKHLNFPALPAVLKVSRRPH